MTLLDTNGSAQLPITIVSGEGALLWDAGGRTYWDFYGGHAVTLLGQGHPEWVDAITRQARQLSFFTSIADVPVRTRAAKALCDFTGMDVAWFVNSGAEAVEGALKVARKATGRTKIIAMKYGFHGRTMGALGVTEKYRGQHAPIHGDTVFVPFGDLEALEAELDETVAAVITEPIQGIAGIIEPPSGWLHAVQERAHAVGALLIADEVQSGMGRTGRPLACHHFGVRPDICTVGKGLGNGFPVAALLLDSRLADTVSPGEHGTTFGGGPMACAAVESTLAVMAKEDLLAKARNLEAAMKSRLAIAGVREVRGRGAWIGLVLDQKAGPVKEALMQRGFLVGTATDPHVLRLAPPAVLPRCAIDLLAEALDDVLAAARSEVA